MKKFQKTIDRLVNAYLDLQTKYELVLLERNHAEVDFDCLSKQCRTMSDMIPKLTAQIQNLQEELGAMQPKADAGRVKKASDNPDVVSCEKADEHSPEPRETVWIIRDNSGFVCGTIDDPARPKGEGKVLRLTHFTTHAIAFSSYKDAVAFLNNKCCNSGHLSIKEYYKDTLGRVPE